MQGSAKKPSNDHGLLLGLSDDDHSLYHTDARHFAEHSAADFSLSTSAITLTASTWTTIVFDTVDAEDDANGDFSLNTGTGVVTIANAGWYIITAGMVIGAATSGTRTILSLGVNGSPSVNANKLVSQDIQAGSNTVVLNVSIMRKFAAADTVQADGWHGASGSNFSSRNDTFLSIARLA